MRDALRCEHVDHFVHMARLLGIPVPECTLVRGLKDGDTVVPLPAPAQELIATLASDDGSLHLRLR